MKIQFLVGLFGLLTLNLTAQREIEYVEYDLPNGMHVILHEEHSTPIVAVSILYHVGSKNEKPNRTGFAHFFEHLLFEGSTNIDRGEYDHYVESNGGTLNANTSQDRTFYYELLPSNQLELGLWLESERLLHAKVDTKGVETQRSVVKEEKRQRIDNQPYASFFTEMFSRMFTEHPYKWQPIGSMDHLDAASEQDYIDFYRTFYVPRNATLSIAGDLNIEETKKWIAKYFGTIPAGQAINLYRDFESLSDAQFEEKYTIAKSSFDADNFLASKNAKAKNLIAEKAKTKIDIPRPEKTNNRPSSVIKDTIYDNIQLPGIFMGYRFPEQTHKDIYALEMLNKVLSGGTSARMNKSIVEDKELATFAFSFAYGLEDAGIGIFAAIAAKDVSVDKIQTEFDAEIEKIIAEPISDFEFNKIRNQFENDFISSNSSVAGIAENLANSHVYFGDANYANTELENYMAVTKEDIQRVAKKYLTNNERVILYYLPKEEGAKK